VQKVQSSVQCDKTSRYSWLCLADCTPKRYLPGTEFFAAKNVKINKKIHVRFLTHFFLIKKHFFPFSIKNK
jgi:hypothetical protein